MIRQDANMIAMGEMEYEGIPALFSELRIDRNTVPPSLSMYEIRHSDEDWAEPVQISDGIMVNFYGTLLTAKPLEMPADGIFLEDNPFEIAESNVVTLDEFMLAHRDDPRESEIVGKAAKERTPQELAKLGEDLACHYLQDNEIEVVERNWKCKSGEVSIVASEDDTLIFIDVKTRSEGQPGLPEYAITPEKRSKYEKIAISYLAANDQPSGRIRFDVIAIQMTGDRQCLLRHHRDAFSTDDVQRAPSRSEEKTHPKSRGQDKEIKPAEKKNKSKAAAR